MEGHSHIQAARVTTPRQASSERRKRPVALIVCLAVPAISLAAAYAYMAFQHGRLWLFSTVVHENGKYTLLETIFYFRHFLWGLPVCVLYSLFIVGAFYSYGRPLVGPESRPSPDIPLKRTVLSGLLVLGIAIVSLLMTAKDFGFRETIMGLLQHRMSELKPLQRGCHWRNHFLNSIVLFSASAASVILYRLVSTRGWWVRRKYWTLLPISFGMFVLVTLVSGITLDPFETPSYLGHQLREVFAADLSIFMFLAMGVLIHLEGKYDAGKADRENKVQRRRKKVVFYLVCWSLLPLLITGFLIAKVLSLDIQGEIARLGGTAGWSAADLFAWHFFEHSLDYVFVVSLVYFLYLLTLRAELRRPAN